MMSGQNVVSKRWNWLRDCLLLAASLLSIGLVSLSLVSSSIAGSSLLLLYVLDLLCWSDLFFRYSQAKEHDQNSRWVWLLCLMITAPWELVLSSATIVSGALPLLWGLRLFRIVQLNAVFSNHELTYISTPGLVRVFRLIVNVFVISHCLACGWLLIGHVDISRSWLHHAALQQAEFVSQYIRSLYWTITTMTTVGYGDITPIQDREYLYAIIVMLVGASFYAYIIGNIAALLGQLNASRSQYFQRMQSVTGYLFRKNVPTVLVHRVQAYYHERWRKYQNINEDDLLSDLPQSLSFEIKSELAQRITKNMPLFQNAPHAVQECLFAALRFEFVAPGCVLARAGERNDNLVFVVEGELDIDFQGEIVGQFGPGEYFGNHSLVLEELRTASVVSNTYCELMYLHRSDYEEIKSLRPEFAEVIKKTMSENSKKMSDLILLGVVL